MSTAPIPPPPVPPASRSRALRSVVVVAGLSGAGKTTAVNALEDLGYYCIENLPPSVIGSALEACEAGGMKDVAIGLSANRPEFVEEASRAVRSVAQGGAESPARPLKILFLDASDEAVQRRFSETRRPHPLLSAFEGAAAGGAGEGSASTPQLDLAGAIHREREMLATIRAAADYVVDTSGLRVHDLRRRVFDLIRPEQSDSARMTVRILSFGFKHGLPNDADLVFDVRFLDNPHFVPELRDKTGESDDVRDYVMRSKDAKETLDAFVKLLTFLVPRYEREGKSYLTVAIGCTGGRHRSVTLARELAAVLPGRPRVVHRDAREPSRSSSSVPAVRPAAAPDPAPTTEPPSTEKGR